MKKILLALTIGFTSFAALCNSAYAQNSVNPIAFNDAKIFKSAIRNMAALESPAFLGAPVADVKSINTKALKDFQSRFNDGANATWFEDKDGFVSYFIKDGYGNRAFYNRNGKWEYSLIFYGEDKLPRDIRAIVKSTYYDMDITLVEEVQINTAKAYFVHLEDRANIKIVRLNTEGDMDTVEELTKQ